VLAPLAARLRGSWLDRELAAGAPPWSTPLHSARSLQITSPRARRSLARSLDRLIERASYPAHPTATSALATLDRAAVLGSREHLRAIADLLRDERPVSTAGIAALRDLLSDGAGPIYSPLSGSGLGRVLVSIRDSLAVLD
jgi:hypothetical protein